jgi:hypothetical protein
MFMCASVRDDNEESELAAGKIVEQLHLAELMDRFSEPSALNSSKFGR